ncbi:phospholipase D family protein [Archangium violaceum]|uniref:phospholipase D-like domain-containing protein n=1 Tax=Archangium violaceum TaxID=83451 RepID=UPI00193C2FCC|nr:phospholipase D-like domain-containing protein [Archangium violaceum]QRK09516.1 phospholipase D family protein [Archangium violaceum]
MLKRLRWQAEVFEHGDNVNLTLLNTDETISRLVSLIKNARKQVLLVSPYVTLGKEDRIGQAIRAALNNKVSVTLIFRLDDDLQSFARTYSEYLQELTARGLQIRVLPKLHAKLYWSESEVIISSLNLLSSSFLSSIEVGLWSKDPADVAQVRQFIKQEIEPHILSGQDFQRFVESKAGGQARTSRSTRQAESPRAPTALHGFCIRCAMPITLNPAKPYCWDDFQEWAEYENANYEDSFCHSCGEEFPATMNKPLCRSCYPALFTRGAGG